MPRCQYSYEFDLPPRKFECNEESIANSEFCIFHDPTHHAEHGDSAAKRFEEKLMESIFENKPLECIGYHLPNLDFSKILKGLRFVQRAYFNRANFYESVDFSEVTFSERVYFEETKFSEEATFYKTTFSKRVFFSKALFLKNVNFYSASFQRGADFSDVIFRGESFFHGAKFSQGAEFFAVIFSGNADFGGVTFSGGATFIWSRFCKEAKFFVTSFNGWTEFIEAKFSKQAHFAASTFSGRPNFSRAKFSERADFRGAKFYEEVDFDRTKYFQEAEFSQSIFSKNVTFLKAEFSKDATFNGTAFYKKADFTGTKFFGSLYITNSRFMDEAYFVRTLFKVKAIFRYTIFEQQDKVTFDDTNLSYASFADNNITRIRFGDNVKWSGKDGFTVIEEEWLRQIVKSGTRTRGSPSLELVLSVYRNLRENYESRLRFDDAGRFFIREMELKRNYRHISSQFDLLLIFLHGKLRLKWDKRRLPKAGEIIENHGLRKHFSLTALYYYLSNYGESVFRPTMTGVAILSISTIYFWTIQSDSQLVSAFERSLADFLPLAQLGGDKVEAADYIVKILSTALVFGLLAIALRRKFERKFTR